MSNDYFDKMATRWDEFRQTLFQESLRERANEHNHTFLLLEQHDRWPGFLREDILNWFTEAGLLDVSVDCAGDRCCATSDCGASTEFSVFLALGKKP